MLCFFNNKDCNVVWYYFSLQFFLMIRNLIIMKVVVVPKRKKKSQLDLYLKEPRLNKKKNSKLEVLSWWKEHYNRFPELSLMARDLMSIPITTIVFESSFSTGKKFLLHIDHVFYLRMWKLHYVLKVGYMDLKVI